MRNCKGIGFLFFILLVSSVSGHSQEDLLELLQQQEEPITEYTIATFKNTRVVSGHSVETNAEGVLQFLIGHRFGRINSGWRELYGLDNAIIRMGFEYGLTDNINIGIGRSSFQKTYDASFKWKLFKQKYGASYFPVTMTWLSNIYLLSQKWVEPDRENYFSSRMTYHHSLMIARKFGDLFSLQLMPSATHRNLVSTRNDNNTILAIGAGSSLRLTGSMRFNMEYYFILPDQISSPIGGESVKNSFSLGIDLETGGHVFQLHFTNSRGMTEKYLIGETTGTWGDGDIHYGFNVSRVFTIKKPKEFKK